MLFMWCQETLTHYDPMNTLYIKKKVSCVVLLTVNITNVLSTYNNWLNESVYVSIIDLHKNYHNKLYSIVK